ncbi:hypothetical protein ACKI1Z_42865, partial [Streptomyces galilaeus]|uniref:hypothetical protein n=1 Tax=Streptomyces galilaeus TaxID=33899 RepID=UPI0038F6F144
SANYDTRDSYAKGVAGDPNYNKNFRNNVTLRAQGLFKIGTGGDLLLRGSYSKLGGSRDSSVATGNFFQLGTDSSTAGNTAAD